MAAFSKGLRLYRSFFYFDNLQVIPICPATPYMQQLQLYTYMVLALSRSLAATQEISVDFFSSSYLDVSVH